MRCSWLESIEYEKKIRLKGMVKRFSILHLNTSAHKFSSVQLSSTAFKIYYQRKSECIYIYIVVAQLFGSEVNNEKEERGISTTQSSTCPSFKWKEGKQH